MVVAAKNVQKHSVKKVPKNAVPPRPPIRNIADEKAADSSGLGSKIHAQRKFAQGANVSVGFSPVKHSKVSHKKRTDKKPISPTFLPSKRPKTEDFLAFLCYRGTPVLPQELDFFNYPPSTESSSNDVSKHEETKKSEEPSEKSTAQPEPVVRASSSSSTNTKKEKSGGTPAKSAQSDSNSKSPALKRIPDVMVVVKQAEKAIAAFGKVRKDLTTALLKPNRINEQDARFAMTALKLKYQEKRMAKTKPALSVAVASKLTKKGRNVILTRSKAKNQGEEKPKKAAVINKKSSVMQRIQKESPSQSRNAPSPDIIYGVSHAKSMSKKSVPPPSSSSSSSSSESNSTESSSSSSEEESENNTPVVRSLRNGKEFVTQAKKPAEPKPPKKQAVSPRVSTRSAHRKSTSPLRELPMYGIPKKKIKKPLKAKKKAEKKQDDVNEGSHRPMRKTKETASICLGLINNIMSSDEEGNSDKNPEQDDSSGNTSSSETKFLEKQYNASMKRVEQNKAGTKKVQKKPVKPKPKKELVTKNKTKAQPISKYKPVRKIPAKRVLRSQSARDKIGPSSEPRRVTTRRLSVPLSTNDGISEGAARKSASVYPRRRGSYYFSSHSSQSESSSSESSSKSSATGSNASTPKKVLKTKAALPARKSDLSSPAKAKETKLAPVSKDKDVVTRRSSVDKSETPKSVSRSSSQASDIEPDELEESTPEEVKRVIIQIQRDTSSASSSSESSDEEDEDADDSSTSSDEEPKPVVSKTSIAIQVDMDSEENVDMTEMYATQTESHVMSMTPPATSSATFTELPNFMSSINIPHPSIPFAPFTSQGPSFYPTLHLTPPVVSNIQLLARGTQEFSLGPPGITMNIPATVPMQTYNSMGGPLLQPNTMCFSSTSISAAATLQTHIRSVAANLDIPLVRPIVGSDNPLNIPFPRPPMPQLANTGVNSMHRPHAMWQSDNRAHSSAFRVPVSSAKPNHPSVMPNSLLPLSIVQPHQAGQQTCSTSTASRIAISNSVRQPGSIPRQAGPAQTSGYSILQSLPNVSIVPRFDRNSKPVVIPPDQEALERRLKKSNESSSTNAKNKEKESKKEKHSKKKKSLVIAQPTSPLTVRKDTTNPVTYVGVTAKKSNKSNRSGSTETHKEPSTDPFNKLLQMKKSEPTTAKSSSCPNPPPTSPSPKEPKKQDTPINTPEEKGKPTDITDICASDTKDESEAPTFYPTDDQFQDPLKYIEKIRIEAEKFGMARIVPPRSFRPDCNVEDDMRFTAYNHYIHKMFQRWGPNVHETIAIKETLRNSDVDISSIPLIGGMEIDLCTLYHTVQSFGGLKETIEKQKWNKVSDAMNIPKAANNRDSKLDSIYVKYVLPYETLSETERKRLLNKIERNWNSRQERLRKRSEISESESDSDEDPLEEVDDCIIKGKSTPLSSYYRVARNTRCMLFPSKEPSCDEVEEEYWKMVRKRTRHLCVYSGSIDCAGVGWGFPLPKASNKHPWNLKVLANSSGSALRTMGPVMGATVPTLHVGMIFTTYCWYRDPHGLPWIEYLHSGGNKIWYVIPASEEEKFRGVVKKLLPLQCKNKKLWLASDSAMVPPELLRESGVSLYRAIQNPGEFLVVFPKAFTSAICTGYVVSESVCYAPNEWLDTAPKTFDDIRNSKEPPVFPLEKLLLSILLDHKVSTDILQRIYAPTEELLKQEFALRKRLMDIGVRTGKLCVKPVSEKVSKKKRKLEDEVQQCDNCNYILHLSLVNNDTHDFTLCLTHALEYLLKRKAHVKTSFLRYDHTQEDLTAMLTEVSRRLSQN
ncbi:unnamed protein product [Allacma fusca]|uniref:Protein Jumonji n=1 Tax=Allacma fusca TaxID=39272 RepID=A0A8J2LLD4_9HEXA|nr:unnamed protein product [Allacma fusca]